LFEALPFLTEPDPRPGVLAYLSACKRVARRPGLHPSKWSLYGFRRTCLSRLVNDASLGMPTVMHAGHRDMKSAMRYQPGLEGRTLQEEDRGRSGLDPRAILSA
jgi:integrase